MALFTSTGDSQTNEELSGKLGLVQHVGNFYTVHLNIFDQVGLWNINISSFQAYTIKVQGNFFSLSYIYILHRTQGTRGMLDFAVFG